MHRFHRQSRIELAAVVSETQLALVRLNCDERLPHPVQVLLLLVLHVVERVGNRVERKVEGHHHLEESRRRASGVRSN